MRIWVSLLSQTGVPHQQGRSFTLIKLIRGSYNADFPASVQAHKPITDSDCPCCQLTIADLDAHPVMIRATLLTRKTVKQTYEMAWSNHDIFTSDLWESHLQKHCFTAEKYIAYLHRLWLARPSWSPEALSMCTPTKPAGHGPFSGPTSSLLWTQ